ncbi:hypothetical protein OG625_20015 [Streptomyces sp. NBC_01351]|uniref:hypothetical protein n=1 Tax=Streptomyces sp. NBC_01351 TaxID=2903833 RepID=UPI002E357F69|nr:hypothetical protein [Streptomyces sp. NBC_01351]
MPIDPYAALNAMLRAEAARFTPPVRQTEPVRPAEPVASESEQPQKAPADPAA